VTNPSAYEQRFTRAQQLQAAGQTDAAIKDYRQLLAEHPDELPLTLALAAALIGRSDSDNEAEAHLRRVQEAVPSNAAVNSLLGQLLVRQGKYDSAHSYLHQAIQLDPQLHEARNSLASLALYQGALDEAYHWIGSLTCYNPTSDVSPLLAQLEMILNKRHAPQSFFCGVAKVFSRSSRTQGGPPGEREILAINPNRYDGILGVTGWQRIEPGTLNLQLLFNFTEAARNIAPLFYESGESVCYPQGYEHIPKARMGYWYYQGYVQSQGQRAPVLFRRAVTPNSEEVVEVFAERNLRETLKLQDGTNLLCYLATPSTEAEENDWLACKLDIHEQFLSEKQAFGRHQVLYQGHEGWGLPGQRPTLHRMEKYSLHNWLEPNARVLDIGCNIGCFGIEVSRHVGHYVGFDINDSLIHIARRLARHHKVENCEFHTWAFEDFRRANPGTFDLIFSFAVHVWIGKPMQDYVADLKQMLNPGGTVVIESNDLKRNDGQFFSNMAAFFEQGFFLLHQGQLFDDGVINRGFCVFKRLD